MGALLGVVPHILHVVVHLARDGHGVRNPQQLQLRDHHVDTAGPGTLQQLQSRVARSKHLGIRVVEPLLEYSELDTLEALGPSPLLAALLVRWEQGQGQRRGRQLLPAMAHPLVLVGQHRVQQGAVLHTACYGAVCGYCAVDLDPAPPRDAAVGGLQADRAAEGAGDADAAAAITAHSKGAEPCCHCCRTAPRGAPGVVARVPGVARGACPEVEARHSQPDLMHVGLAQQDGTQVLEAGHKGSTHLDRPPPGNEGGARSGGVGQCIRHILHDEGHALQGPGPAAPEPLTALRGLPEDVVPGPGHQPGTRGGGGL
mmetsp:Transcript_29145/g.64426  ORF Transcript_29145/g.64426 Transcript_29145/m.64426 type:complete len:314 (-) Transcript_29145:467-1408(-)